MSDVNRLPRGDFAVRRATADDVKGVASVFGDAFADYRQGFGISAPDLARLWHGSFAARVARTIVATDQDGRVIGFAIVVMPGEKEFEPQGGRREPPPFREVIGPLGFWRMPAMFIPMGLAFAHRRTKPDEAYLSFLGVSPSVRGRGVGGSLLHTVEGAARRSGAAGILLHTARDNVSARRVYARAGYRVETLTRSPWIGPNGIDGYVSMLRRLV